MSVVEQIIGHLADRGHLLTEEVLEHLGIPAGQPHTIPQALHDSPLALPPQPPPSTCPTPLSWPANPANYSTASHGRPHDTWVVHAAECKRASSACSWFADAKAQCSAHFTIDVDGTVYAIVPTDDIAWHSGNANVNCRSVGVEHAGFTGQPFTPEQYAASARLIRSWCLIKQLRAVHVGGILDENYVVPAGQLLVIDHSQVPTPGHPGKGGGAGQHQDCGKAWDWGALMRAVQP